MTIHDLKSASEFLHCKPEFVRQKAASGEILASKVTGQWLIEEQELVRFVRSGYPVERQKLTVIDGFKQEEAICPSINAVKAVSTGYRSNRPTANKYAELLALPTKKRLRNSTTN